MSDEITTNKYEIDMSNGPIMKKLISFSIPLVISSNLQLLFNTVDLIVVGNYSENEYSMAAIGSTTALINLLITLFMGISIGSNVLAGNFFASKNDDAMHKTVHTSIAFALLSGVIISVAGIILAPYALKLMDTPEQILDQAVLYIRIYLIGMPAFMVYTYGAAILRAVGDTKRPLMFLIIAGVTNALLNLVLVIVFHLDVVGVGIATVISEIISCILVLRCLCKTNSSYKLEIKKLKIDKAILKKLFKIGLPAGIQSVVINFSNVLLQSSVNYFGPTAVAGYTAANSIFGFLYVTINSFSQTCMSFMSQNFGVKKLKRMDKVLNNCIRLSVSVTLVLGCLVLIFGRQIIRVYTNQPDAIDCGMEIFLYTTSTYFICALMDIYPSAMRSMGYSTAPMILSVIGTVGVRIFWIYCIFPMNRALDFLFISYPLSWAVTVLLQMVCYYFVRKKVHKQINVHN